MIQLPQDKANHFLYGSVIFLLIAAITTPLIGLVAATLIGAGKEIINDKLLKNGSPDFLDFAATAAGAIVGYFCTKL
jgi:hypothetical protein